MDTMRRGSAAGAPLLALLIGMGHCGAAFASLPQGRSPAPAGLPALADTDWSRAAGAASRARAAARAPGAAGTRAVAAARADRPVTAVSATGEGQAGYVHYFLLRLPDETLEIQVGIEMPDQAIAWSFPGLGVTVSPFIESGVIVAEGREYEVWHLYGLRPFPEDAAMNTLRRELAGRVQTWVRAAPPYCEHDGPHAKCMSCLGFVLRVLFPGRQGEYPSLPRDFWRAGMASKYTTRDLLLYLTGMLDLPTREARLQRIARLNLPDNLREDLQELVYAMGALESGPAAGAAAAQAAPKRIEARPARLGIRPAQRGRL